jgi:hypothetical protein
MKMKHDFDDLLSYPYEDTNVAWLEFVGCHDPLPSQVIGYMENIELPTMRLDVVRETMSRSQKFASECGDKYAVVTYDLAIAIIPKSTH